MAKSNVRVSNVRVSKGDIFSVKKEGAALVNTGSRQHRYWSLLPGIFNRKFGVSYFIEKNGRKDLYFQRGVIDRDTGRRWDVFTLIVKESEGETVSEKHLVDLLYELKEFCEKHDIHQLVMPKICCGVHGCRWTNVNKLLRGVFDGSDIYVTVKYLE